MSATGRGDTRDSLDRYDTPAWPVHRLLETVDLPRARGSRWLEPCAGSGSIRDAIESAWWPADIDWTELDIDPRHARITRADFFEWVWSQRLGTSSKPFDVLVTNPPYAHAFRVAYFGLQLATSVALLLRLNWIEGAVTQERGRYEFLRATRPDVHVLPNRPQYLRDGKPLVDSHGRRKGTDAIAYAWVVWSPESDGRWSLLEPTPAEERKVEL